MPQLGQGWGLGQQLPVDTSPGWDLVLRLLAPSLADHITNIFSLRGLHLPPSEGFLQSLGLVID